MAHISDDQRSRLVEQQKRCEVIVNPYVPTYVFPQKKRDRVERLLVCGTPRSGCVVWRLAAGEATEIGAAASSDTFSTCVLDHIAACIKSW
jgi:hypothetical protein